jgi:hypothetical protein
LLKLAMVTGLQRRQPEVVRAAAEPGALNMVTARAPRGLYNDWILSC